MDEDLQLIFKNVLEIDKKSICEILVATFSLFCFCRHFLALSVTNNADYTYADLFLVMVRLGVSLCSAM